MMQLKMCHWQFNHSKEKSHASFLKTLHESFQGDMSSVLRTHQQQTPMTIFLPSIARRDKHQDLINAGYLARNHKCDWPPEDVAILEDFVKDLARGTTQATTKNPYWYLHHHIFNGRISEQDIRKKVKKYFYK